MKTRYRWVLINIDISLDDLVNVILNNGFDSRANKGYIVNNLDHDSIDAIFVERVIQYEKINRPDGTEDEIKIERFLYTSFVISIFSRGKFLIRIENSPRTLNEFIMYLKNILDYNFFVESVNINIFKLIPLMMNDTLKNINIKKIKASNIIINTYSSAIVEVTSSINALDVFMDKFKVKDFKLEYAKLTFSYDNTTYTLDIKNSGITVDNMAPINLIEKLICHEYI